MLDDGDNSFDVREDTAAIVVLAQNLTGLSDKATTDNTRVAPMIAHTEWRAAHAAVASLYGSGSARKSESLSTLVG